MSRFSPDGSNTRPMQAQARAEPEPPGVPARTVLSLLLLLIGIAAMAGGVAWWLHPGAGVAILGADLFVVALLIGRE